MEELRVTDADRPEPLAEVQAVLHREFMDYIPILFASALEKQRIFQVVEKAVQVYNNKVKKIPTSRLNDALLPEIVHYPPPAIKGKHIQIKYITQVNAATPTFAFFCNLLNIFRSPTSGSWKIG